MREGPASCKGGPQHTPVPRRTPGLGPLKSISGTAISNDGKWAIYSLAPLLGDGELVVGATSGTTEYRGPRGYLAKGRDQVPSTAPVQAGTTVPNP